MHEEGNGSDTFVLLQVAGTTYAVRSVLVQQMEMIEHITAVPNAAPMVEGVVFSRGRVIPAINLRVRFGFERVPLDAKTRLVIVSTVGRTIGLIVDTAREFISIPADSIQPPGEAISGLSGKYVDGIATLGNRIILLLNLEEVINLSEVVIDDHEAPAGAR